MCPITSRVRGYTFEVAVPSGLAAAGVILTDQLKTVDWAARGITFIDKLPDAALLEVFERVEALLSFNRR